MLLVRLKHVKNRAHFRYRIPHKPPCTQNRNNLKQPLNRYRLTIGQLPALGISPKPPSPCRQMLFSLQQRFNRGGQFHVAGSDAVLKTFDQLAVAVDQKLFKVP